MSQAVNVVHRHTYEARLSSTGYQVVRADGQVMSAYPFAEFDDADAYWNATSDLASLCGPDPRDEAMRAKFAAERAEQERRAIADNPDPWPSDPTAGQTGIPLYSLIAMRGD